MGTKPKIKYVTVQIVFYSANETKQGKKAQRSDTDEDQHEK